MECQNKIAACSNTIQEMNSTIARLEAEEAARAEVARTMNAHKPKLIIMDEPTVAVDPQSRNKILEGIVELNRQKMSMPT